MIRLEEVPGSGLRLPFVRRVIAWEDLAHVLETPGDVFSNAYRWGQDTFDEQAFAENVGAFAGAQSGCRSRGTACRQASSAR